MTTGTVVNMGDAALDGASGVLRGFVSDQLNANFVMLDDGECMESHSNDEVDVVIVVQAGEGQIEIDGVSRNICADSIAIIPRGATRSITATRRLLYFTIHQRRDGLTVLRS